MWKWKLFPYFFHLFCDDISLREIWLRNKLLWTVISNAVLKLSRVKNWNSLSDIFTNAACNKNLLKGSAFWSSIFMLYSGIFSLIINERNNILKFKILYVTHIFLNTAEMNLLISPGTENFTVAAINLLGISWADNRMFWCLIYIECLKCS